MTETPRVAHLISHPIQYYAPLYRELAMRGNIDLTVFFRSDQGLVGRVDPGFGTAVAWDIPLLEGYRSRFLCGSSNQRSAVALSPAGLDIVAHLAHGRYDVLWVHGYSHLVNQVAILAAKMLAIPVLLRDDAHLLDRRPPLKRAAKACLLKPMMKLVAGALYVGTENRVYYQHYGLRSHRLFPAPHVVDNAYFQHEARRLVSGRANLRQQFGFTSDQTVFAFVGKLVPKKAPLDLVKAFAMVQKSHQCGLLIAGDGPLRGQVEQEISDRGVSSVTITGFLNQSQISTAYAAADVLVLPSIYGETWGLVVNEAMNCGLPIIASNKVGSATDLVEPGGNGFTFPAGDVDGLAAAMITLACDVSLRAGMGERSREIIETQTIPILAAAIEDACYKVARHAPLAGVASRQRD